MVDAAFTQDSSSAILNKAQQVDKANVFRSNTQHPFSIQSVTLALDTAQLIGTPYKLNFPFKSLYVVAATDTATTVSMQPSTVDSYQSSVPLKLNDAMNFDAAQSNCVITWTAQSGKSITLVFFVDASFRSGSQVTTFAGGLAIQEGSAFTTAVVALVANTATSVAAALGTRKVATIQNNTGANVWFGGSSVSNTGANTGIMVAPGNSLVWKNTAQLFALSVAGGNVVNMEEA